MPWGPEDKKKELLNCHWFSGGFTVKYNEGQTVAPTSFLSSYVIAMLILKIVSERPHKKC